MKLHANFRSLNILKKHLLVAGICNFILIYILFVFVFTGAGGTILKDTLIRDMETTADTYLSLLSPAVKSGDDISVIKYLGALSKKPGCLYAMIVDDKGKILAHNIITERNTYLNENHVTPENNEHQYRIEISSGIFFIYGISLSRTGQSGDNFSRLRVMTLLLGAFTFVALTIINSTLFYFMVWLPVRDLNFGIRSVLIGKQGELL
ncbi:MAG: hypothetical protein ABIJ11_08135, partial [Elusimicrobiota bacterium]